MELTYVLYNDGVEWRRIDLKEAIKRFPYGSPYYSRRFKCGYCNQYLVLAVGPERQYFKHSSSEADKSCEERSFGMGGYSSSSNLTSSFNIDDFSLPLRLNVHSDRSFELEVGLIPVSQSCWKGVGNFKVKIDCFNRGVWKSARDFVYNKERIDPSTTTYLSLGSIPFDHYNLSVYSSANDENTANAKDRLDSLLQYWSPRFDGVKILSGGEYCSFLNSNYVSGQGAIFSQGAGKKILPGGTLQIGRHYLVLTNSSTERFTRGGAGLEAQTVCWGEDNWRVIKVLLKEDNDNVRWFANLFHCQVSANQVSFSPIYPVCIEYPYSLRHAGNWKLYFTMQGNATPHIAPKSSVATLPLNADHSYSLLIVEDAKSAQQMLALGDQSVLEYSYLWRDLTLLQKESSPPVTPVVQDLAGKTIRPGEHKKLPQQKTLRIMPSRDATLRITRQGATLNELKLPANYETRYEGLKLGDELEICYGLDAIWQASFISAVAKGVGLLDDNSLYRELASYYGDEIPINHSLGVLGEKLRDFPLVGAWLRRQIRFGRVSRQARERLLNALSAHGKEEIR